MAGLVDTLTVSRLSAQTAAAGVDFARDVQPLLRANCYGCHGPSLQNGSLRLDRRRDVMPNRVGANGARIVPGNSGVSRVYLRVAGTSAGLQMPPSGALPAEQIAIIKAWIDQGAPWPDAFAGDAPSPPQDPQAARLMDALRAGRRTEFERTLRASPSAAKSKGTGGSTPLMFAALYGDTSVMRSLLDSGADPNARNDAGATALMWAIDDAEKTRILLSRGADPNVRSDDGATPLLLAATRPGSLEVVKALLDSGAKPTGQPVFGRAAGAGDEAVMRLLLDRGAPRTNGGRDLAFAMRSSCSPCVDLLLESATVDQLNRALSESAGMGDSVRVGLLLDRGALASGDALRLAASSEKIPTAAVKRLLDRGARDDAALRVALAYGDTDVVSALRAAGAKETGAIVAAPARSSAPLSPREAAERSLPALQQADVVFLKTAGCVSCHNNSLFQMTTALARSRGFQVDEATDAAQQKVIGAYIESWRERLLQDIPIPGAVDTVSFMLAGLADMRYPADVGTDAMARYLLRRQDRDGGWRIATSIRPPIESSNFTATALAIRGLQVYAPAPHAAAYAQSARRAAAWLRAAEPRTMEDHAFQLLGLVWAHDDKRPISDAVRRLTVLQRSDGGWSQLATLQSDAYATGQALTALAAGGVSVKDSVYQRGVAFLLRTQVEDGSWFVRSRAIPVQPYFDSGFPHGRDQFISAAATNWATMALMLAAR
jgi:ankyrin repeat protein